MDAMLPRLPGCLISGELAKAIGKTYSHGFPNTQEPAPRESPAYASPSTIRTLGSIAPRIGKASIS